MASGAATAVTARKADGTTEPRPCHQSGTFGVECQPGPGFRAETGSMFDLSAIAPAAADARCYGCQTIRQNWLPPESVFVIFESAPLDLFVEIEIQFSKLADS
jgi:hypothetical protein